MAAKAFKSTSSMFVLIIFLCTMASIESKFEFTNINCTVLDKEYMGVECFLKSVNRTYKYMTLRTKIRKFPLKDLKVKVQVLKRLSGYKPFLFNFTLDACKFLKGQKSPMIQFFYELFSPYSNMVHPCPYYHDAYVEKLPISYLDHILTNVLPMPEGQYCVHSIYTVQGIPRFDLKVYVAIS